MITFLLIFFLVLSLGLNVAAYLIIRNLLRKNSTYEAWILEFKQDVTDTLAIMRAIDKQAVFATVLNDKGAFESDDQVGQIFKELLEIIEKLNSRTQ